MPLDQAANGSNEAHARYGNNWKMTAISLVVYVSGLVAELFFCGSGLLLPRGAPTEVLRLGASIPPPPTHTPSLIRVVIVAK